MHHETHWAVGVSWLCSEEQAAACEPGAIDAPGCKSADTLNSTIHLPLGSLTGF